MKVTFFGLITLASAVLAADDYFQIRSPSKGTTLTAGDVSTIRWDKGVEGKVLVNILKGNDPLMMMPTGMAFMTSGAQNMQKWRVPNTLDPKETYALEFNYKSPDGQAAQSFSDQFKVSTQKKMTTGSTNMKENIQGKTTSQDMMMTSGSTNMKENTQGRTTSQDMMMSSPSQGMKQTAQGTPKKPSSRRVMKISITYPNEGEEQTENGSTVNGASPVKMRGGAKAIPSSPVKMRSGVKAIPAQGSVLDRYAAANTASSKGSKKASI